MSEASIKRWCDNHRLPAARTAGGHRRLHTATVLQFVRESGLPLAEPAILGLPASPSLSEEPEAVRSLAFSALRRGDGAELQRLVLGLYLAGWTCAAALEKVVVPALEGIGDAWERGRLEVYEERRACELVLALLHELRRCLPEPPTGAPRALGGTLAGDPYRVPTRMVALVLREAGWRADSFGCGLPAVTLLSALEREKPDLVWLSVSVIENRADFLETCRTLAERATQQGAALVVGGRALTTEVRRQLTYSAYCDTLGHLQCFLKTLERSGSEQQPRAG